ncbi:FAD-dependent oxidoreductase [Mycobacterium ulcerans]|uniref:phytoene desaturase family protein n=1 Tax=Mycobacterium ulcerans TaxID=1809 RepID=UPI000ABE2758|nr:FAD-dependent oxidoreductase [Mycobacterium ulcerans]MEB3905171.1 FAD-dependent oxidoreductase [Mycobacterium ulcerans]MEB3909376.1 FAD-dependent oxidoreductase [Mycobacterium ulcerans]MEB3923662.1 FAD-dependent oxidoreductase [Mycobacterium ulcerans]MEB3931982.1 FAD-dependent oxidoreductase [Mycobacterium ulcerans]MEB3936140.1 FAD-dependent oxidoreductase [Mycobacterium ulcerans]
MPRSGYPPQFDAVVIGSGISGLTAAINLQRNGIRTLVVERREVPGGLCGTFTLDGYEFVTGCNDFGGGLVRHLEELGVGTEFRTPAARFHLGEHRIEMPPTLPTLATVARRLPALFSAFRTVRKGPGQTLGQLIDGAVQDRLLMAAAAIPAYALLRSPDDLTVEQVGQAYSKQLGYRYQKSYTPVGGPAAMIAAMVQRFEALGGELWLGCHSTQVERVGAEKRVHTSDALVPARVVLSSAGRWSEFPKTTKAGMEFAVLLFAVRKGFTYPRGYHTIAWLQQDIGEELRKLDAGQPISRPSFHIFRSDLPQPRDHYTINAFIPLPRGEGDPSARRRQDLSAHAVATIDKDLPGFKDALMYQRFLSPVEYASRLGLHSAPSSFVPPTGFAGLPSYDAARDTYFIGTSVGPAGEHAGAACLSGKMAADLAIKQLRR